MILSLGAPVIRSSLPDYLCSSSISKGRFRCGLIIFISIMTHYTGDQLDKETINLKENALNYYTALIIWGSSCGGSSIEATALTWVLSHILDVNIHNISYHISIGLSCLIRLLFWATGTSNNSLCDMAPMSCVSVLSVCNVGANGWMDQDATPYRGRPQPRRHRVRWGPSYPTEVGTAATLQFSAQVYWGQTAGYIRPANSENLVLKIVSNWTALDHNNQRLNY